MAPLVTWLLLSFLLGAGATCNDGVFEPQAEECDDGNAVGGDGCEANCTLSTTGPSCATDCPAMFDLNIPSWLNHKAEQYPDITVPFQAGATNTEVCFAVNRPYTVTGLWYLGGTQLPPALVPNEFPAISTRFGSDARGRGWGANSAQPAGPCFDRMAANVPNNQEWDITTKACSTMLRRCFNPFANDLPTGCTSSHDDSDATTVLECTLFQALLRPKDTDVTDLWPADGMAKTDYSYYSHKFSSRFVYKLSAAVVTNDVQFITPYVNVRVTSSNLLQGTVELSFGDGVNIALQLDCPTGPCEQMDVVVDDVPWSLELVSATLLQFNPVTTQTTHYKATIPLTFVNTNNGDKIHMSVHIDTHNVLVESGPISLGIDSSLQKVYHIPTISGPSMCVGEGTGCVLVDEILPATSFSVDDTLAICVPDVQNDLLELTRLTIGIYGDMDPIIIITTSEGIIGAPEGLPEYWNVQNIDFEGTSVFPLSPTGLNPVYGVAFRLGVEAGQYHIKIFATFDVRSTSTSKRHNTTSKLHKLNQEESSLTSSASSISATIPLSVRRSTSGGGATTSKSKTAIVPIFGGIMVVLVAAIGVFAAREAKRKFSSSSSKSNTELTPTNQSVPPEEDPVGVPQIDLQL